ncbi:MAG: universal stress protein [Salinivenus sp.]
MLSIDRIVWPTDLSSGAEEAFPHAAALAAWHEAELHIVHVTQEGEGKPVDFPLDEHTLRGFLSDRPSSPAAPPVALEDLSFIQEQRTGAAADEIVGYAEDRSVDLVVMGTHGQRGLRRLFVGSVTEAVVRSAPCPVFTVRAGHASPLNVRNILAPVDFSEGSTLAVRHARELALTYGAQITLLHAVEEAVYPSAYGVEPAPLPSSKIVRRVEKSLAALARDEIGYEHVVVEARVGHAASVTLDYVEEHDVDLIAIATHGRTGWERMLLGSVTERVVRRANRPVFVVKPFGKSLVPEPERSATNAE